MPNPTLVLAEWLEAILTAYSLGMWGIVFPLAGGPNGPLWRWVLVEEGIFILFVFLAMWWTHMVLGLGNTGRTPQHWGTAAVFACCFSLLWCWYSLVATYAIGQGLHPNDGWEWLYFTWGLPMLLSGAILPGDQLVPQLGLALPIGTVLILLLGRAWPDGGRGRSSRGGR